MRSVHPAFDVRTLTWFTTERGLQAEAETLAELKAKLGAEVEIKGYHPAGYRPERSRSPRARAASPRPLAPKVHPRAEGDPAAAANPKPTRAPYGSLKSLSEKQRADRRREYFREHRRRRREAAEGVTT